VNDTATKNFGVLIAYVLPGFAALWSLQPYSATLRLWLSASPTLPAGLESVVFACAAAVGGGMVLSAVRWLIIDTTMSLLGVRRPQWDDSRFGARREAFEALVDAHFRYYQFYAHTALVLPLFAINALVARGKPAAVWIVAMFIASELILLLAAHDSLTRYFVRTSRLLASHSKTGRSIMTNGHHKPAPKKQPPKQQAQPKPSTPPVKNAPSQ